MYYIIMNNSTYIFISELILIITVLTSIMKKNSREINIPVIIISLIISVFFNINMVTFYNDILLMNNLTRITSIIILVSILFIYLILWNYRLTSPILPILFSVLGMLFVISSNNLLLLYTALEIQSISFYLLASINNNSEYSTEVSIKYFILGGLSSGILLFGISLLYFFTGTINLDNISMVFYSDLLFVPILFINIGLLFKLAAAPFHWWAPDVYEGALTIISQLFAILPKLPLLFLLLNLNYSNSFIFFFAAILSLFFGSLGGLLQNSLKRLLAFSSITHVGFLLIPLYLHSLFGIQAFFVYIILYIPMTMFIWTSLAVLQQEF